MIRRKTRDLLQCHSSEPLPLVAVICQHELHTISSLVPPSSRIFLVAPRVRTTRGRGVFFSGLFLATTTLEVMWTDAVPNFAYTTTAICIITHTLLRRHLANPRRPSNHKIFRETNVTHMRQHQMPNVAYGLARAVCTTQQVNSCFCPVICRPLIESDDHGPPWSQINESGSRL
ncbi:hypothetical protein CORC01_10590 [Colletotrichum orchidophilum]|uniref:Uncharacterized protein n=1 Tax=Colletotrichum orchidophilum TaxID=1209926 RepID=A0A1G4AYH5_9PEZI|nr:uncharacterized protein CORC01_10590 [Colletotrichum orchidophilum]OHE94133.1 hypothetical protein CORC01_10590 [Colletotrichum orchidophilum]